MLAWNQDTGERSFERVTDTYSYTAFGELLNHTGTTTNPYQFTGQQFDALTELYSLRARYYNPALGRFLSQDTYLVNFSNPVELNRYVYTANNPINAMDPTGNFALTEYAISLAKKGAALGALYGIGQTLACGGNLIGNVLFGSLTGAGFGIAFAYYPLATSAGGMVLGGKGAISAINDIRVNHWNKCNTFNAVTSLLMIVLSGWGAAREINNSLRGLGEFGVPDEFLPSSMWNEGYYSGTGPYSALEWSQRIEISQRWKSGFCHECAQEMQNASYQWGRPDRVVGIFNDRWNNPLLGPGGSDIGAPRGWHTITIDRFGYAWDNWGLHGPATNYINSILIENPRSFSKEFGNATLLLWYIPRWASGNP